MSSGYSCTKELKKFMWVLMHHPDYWQCYFRSPIVITTNRYDFGGDDWICRLQLGIRYPSIYFPFQVSEDYLVATGRRIKVDCEYDEIPF